MTGGLTLALNNAASGLSATQRALDVVAGNISNANNTTYSRKTTEFESRSLNGLGAGVKVGAIQRSIDEHLLRASRQETSKLTRHSAQGDYYERLQQMFGRPEDNSSISHQINRLQKAVETMAETPERSLEHLNTVHAGRDLAYMMNEMTETMQELRRQADDEIETAVAEINRLTTKIDQLNDSIVAFTSVSRDTTDMQDERDAAISDLSDLIDVDYFSRADGDIAVFTAKGATLVDKSAHQLTHTAVAASSAGAAYAEGGFTGIYAGEATPGNDITDEISGGKIKGFLEMRDDVIPRLQAQLDELSSDLRDTFNQIHNRGVPFPGMQTATGTRTIQDPAFQTIQLTAPQDVAIALTDSDGAEQARTTLNTIMVAAGQADHGQWSVNNVSAAVQSWFRANGAATATAAVNTDGKFEINLNTTELNFAFRDQDGSAPGSSQEDASIAFNKDAVSGEDETVEGFSNFFGLNDFFTSGQTENSYESETRNRWRSDADALLQFNDDGGAGALGGVLIPQGSSMQETADLINNNVPGVSASVVPDGAGHRLRIGTEDGSEFSVTDTLGGGVLDDLGMGLSNTGLSRSIAVRQELIDSPGRVSRGALQWDAAIGAGEFVVSRGDASIANAMAEAMSDANQFETAGGFDPVSLSFERYAAQIVAAAATNAESNERTVDVQESLTDSLKTKHKNESGVNLDEEMALLIVFEQSYAAAARVISTIQRMFEALERAF